MTDKPSAKLPPLRPGLTLAPGQFDAEGKPQWLIHDAGRNKFFIIGWSEYELLNRWSLGDQTKIIAAVNKETTLHVDDSDVDHLLKFLAKNYLTKLSGYEIYAQAKEQKLFKNDNFFSWLVGYYLFFRVPLTHPDKFLDRTKVIGDIMFSRYTFYVMLFLLGIALYQLSMVWETFTHTFTSIFTWQGIFFSLIAFVFCKLFHELGHAYMCKRYGIPVPTLGVAFLVFWPVLYTDTTLSWRLPNTQRMNIALAGMWIETYITIFAALIWCNTTNITLQSICYITIMVNWLGSVLINVSPFMRFDGYYVLADYLNMPNLQARAFALTRWQIRKWLFQWEDPVPEKFSHKLHYFLIFYSLFTWLYRLILYIGIAVLVYHFFIKIVGILLFAIELYYFILGPIITEIQTWFQFKDKFYGNQRTKLTIFFACLGLLLLVLPVKESLTLPATLSYAHQFLYAPQEGIIATTLPQPGSIVKADQSILEIESPELNKALANARLTYSKKLAELRRASVNQNYTFQKNILLSDLNKQAAEYKKLSLLEDQLKLKVPFNGVIVDVAPDLQKGTAVKKNEWIGDVARKDEVQIEAYVTQVDLKGIKPGITGYFYPYDLGEAKVPVRVSSIEILNSNQLSCNYSKELKQNADQDIVVATPCYHASEQGGAIATLMDSEGKYVSVNSIYRVLLTATSREPLNIEHVERGTVKLSTSPHSIAYRFFYSIKSLLIEQSDF